MPLANLPKSLMPKSAEWFICMCLRDLQVMRLKVFAQLLLHFFCLTLQEQTLQRIFGIDKNSASGLDSKNHSKSNPSNLFVWNVQCSLSKLNQQIHSQVVDIASWKPHGKVLPTSNGRCVQRVDQPRRHGDRQTTFVRHFPHKTQCPKAIGSSTVYACRVSSNFGGYFRPSPPCLHRRVVHSGEVADDLWPPTERRIIFSA